MDISVDRLNGNIREQEKKLQAVTISQASRIAELERTVRVFAEKNQELEEIMKSKLEAMSAIVENLREEAIRNRLRNRGTSELDDNDLFRILDEIYESALKDYIPEGGNLPLQGASILKPGNW